MKKRRTNCWILFLFYYYYYYFTETMWSPWKLEDDWGSCTKNWFVDWNVFFFLFPYMYMVGYVLTSYSVIYYREKKKLLQRKGEDIILYAEGKKVYRVNFSLSLWSYPFKVVDREYTFFFLRTFNYTRMYLKIKRNKIMFEDEFFLQNRSSNIFFCLKRKWLNFASWLIYSIYQFLL